MNDKSQIFAYYGPADWFQAELDNQLDGAEAELLEDIVFARDQEKNKLRLVTQSDDSTPKPDSEIAPRPEHVVAGAGAYAGLTESAVTNFSGLIHAINPCNLYLHNPPEGVLAQVGNLGQVHKRRFSYDAFSTEVLRGFHQGFGSHLVGQETAKQELLAAMYALTKRSSKNPVVVMFYGPSGVGKTETAKFISELVGGSLFRKQFSMLHSEKFASYVFGGAHYEPSLALDLLGRGSNVILFDEFDKAAPVFHSAFYELFDEGVLEDKNYRTEVGSSLIICTSNYHSEEMVRRELGEALASRFDAFVQFYPLSENETREVIHRIFEAKKQELDPFELKMLDLAGLESNFLASIESFGNIRTLGNMVDQAIGLNLAMHVIENGETSERAGD